MKRQLTATLTGLVLSLWVAAPAQAVTFTVDGVGDSISLDFDGFGSEFGDPVSASLDFEVTSFSGSTIVFEVTAENTSTTDPSRLTGFGFDIDPAASSGSTSSSIFNGIVVDETPQANQFNVCVGGTNEAPDPDTLNNCNGFQGGLAYNTAPHTFNLTLMFDDPVAGQTFELTNFFVRLQGIGENDDSAKLTDGGGEEGGGGEEEGGGGEEEGGGAPEPGTLALLGLGLAATAAKLRRRAVVTVN